MAQPARQGLSPGHPAVVDDRPHRGHRRARTDRLRDVLTPDVLTPDVLTPREGRAVAVDGPYAEAKEVLASFAIGDCASHDRALDIAGRIVEAIGDTVEVRPIGVDPTADG
ncbi:YciI family protein [Amycolatopsis arida]|uniref:YciI family protein n=1 Tax=Amycolatopsis arida TaxID=587909 RepID=UPI001AB0216D|nr:YciI family protein [Amycolatopsis arida]